MTNRPKFDLRSLTIFGIGAFSGAWWVRNQIENAQKSRAEREAPALVEQVCPDVMYVLDQLVLDGEFRNEDAYRQALAQYLRRATGYEVEIAPPTAHGAPDLLVEGILALELKILATKADMDRAVGQCAGYALDWVTWVVTFETPKSRIRSLERLLDDHGLGRILVVDFSDDADLDEDDDDDGGDDEFDDDDDGGDDEFDDDDDGDEDEFDDDGDEDDDHDDDGDDDDDEDDFDDGYD
jgi:hypothetical protein